MPQDEEPMAKLKKEGKSVAALELTDEMTTKEQRVEEIWARFNNKHRVELPEAR